MQAIHRYTPIGNTTQIEGGKKGERERHKEREGDGEKKESERLVEDGGDQARHRKKGKGIRSIPTTSEQINPHTHTHTHTQAESNLSTENRDAMHSTDLISQLIWQGKDEWASIQRQGTCDTNTHACAYNCV